MVHYFQLDKHFSDVSKKKYYRISAHYVSWFHADPYVPYAMLRTAPLVEDLIAYSDVLFAGFSKFERRTEFQRL